MQKTSQMITPQIISEGAEAKIFSIENKDGKDCKSSRNQLKHILKQRTAKSYRHPAIDTSLRQFRTRREAKIIERLQSMNFPAPKLLKSDDKNMEIEMEFIPGPRLRDVLHEKHLDYSKEIGKRIAEMHSMDIVHGDLTTSNMILCDKTNQIKFIDFGLSKFSNKDEDKAVDLHLLRRALESKHHLIYEECFQAVMEEYQKHYANFSLIFDRLEKVEKRGKYKKKGGH